MKRGFNARSLQVRIELGGAFWRGRGRGERSSAIFCPSKEGHIARRNFSLARAGACEGGRRLSHVLGISPSSSSWYSHLAQYADFILVDGFAQCLCFGNKFEFDCHFNKLAAFPGQKTLTTLLLDDTAISAIPMFKSARSHEILVSAPMGVGGKWEVQLSRWHNPCM